MQGTKIKIKQPSREINSKSRLRLVKNKRNLPRNFLYAESGGPPLKEYKQSRAEHKQVLILIPLKEKFPKILLIYLRNSEVQ